MLHVFGGSHVMLTSFMEKNTCNFVTSLYVSTVDLDCSRSSSYLNGFIVLFVNAGTLIILLMFVVW